MTDSVKDSSNLSDGHAWIAIGIAAGLFVLLIPVVGILGVKFTYTLRTVTFGGALLGAISGAVGSFAVLKKQSLLGDALSHAALPGVGIAFLVAGRDLRVLLIGAAAASVVGVWFISLITRTTRIKQDTAMGIVLAGWFALGIGILAFIQQRPDASQAGLDSFIFGQAAAIVQHDVRFLMMVGTGLLVVLLLGWKEFKLISFDPDFAHANGFKIRLISGILLTIIVFSVVMGLQLAGVVLMAGLLIAPGIAARQWTNKLEQMVILAGIIGAISGSGGAILSALDKDLPTGPMIIVIAASLAFTSLLIAPERGLISTWNQQRMNRIHHAGENVRKITWEYAQSHSDWAKAVSEDFLVHILGRIAKRGIRDLIVDGELVQGDGGYKLTDKGRDIATGEKAKV